MSSRIAPPQAGGRDQRKVYTDWANNRLKKAGFADCQVVDLQKDITDGLCLPKIIQAVVQDTVPGITPTPTNDQERKQNIEACVRFLQCLGINCVGFTVKDVSEGSMRAILQLFFSLSHYKPKASGDGEPPPSRISRPTSPGLRMIHSVSSRSTHGSSSLHASPANSHQASPEPRTGSSLGLHASSAPGTAQLPPVASASAPSGPASPSMPHVSSSSSVTIPATNSVSGDRPSAPVGGSTSLKHRQSQSRRHAGSGIPTGMDPMGQVRRVPYRALVVSPGGPKIERQGSHESLEGSDPDLLKSPVLGTRAEVKSSSPTEIPPPSTSSDAGSGGKSSGILPPKSISSGLKAPGSHSGLKPPGSSSSNKSEPEAFRSKENAKPDSTPSNSDGSSSSLAEDKETLEKDGSTSGGSRLKFPHPASSIPSTGRSTPTLGSGLARPSHRLPRSSESKSGLRMPSAGDKAGKGAREASPNRHNLPEPSSGSDQGEGSSKAAPTDPAAGQGGSGIPGAPRSGIPSRGAGLVKPHHEPSPLLAKSYALPDEPAPTSHLKVGDEDHKKGGIPRSASTSASERRMVSKFAGNIGSGIPGSKIRAPGGGGTTQHEGSLPRSGIVPPGDHLKDHPKKLSMGSKLGQLQRPTPRLSLGNLKAPSPEEPTNSDMKSVSASAIISPTRSESRESDSNARKTPTSKPSIPSPLVIDVTSINSPPAATDTCSSSGSISSISIGSANSQSDGSLVDVQAPSPFGSRKYGQRTSPEGMSVDETSSPQDQDRKLGDLGQDNEIGKNKEALAFTSVKMNGKASDLLMSSEVPCIGGTSPPKEHMKRARSLSPKSSHRITTLTGGGMPAVKSSSGNLQLSPEHQVIVGTASSEENIKNSKPMRSSLRSPRGSGSLSKATGKKVTISPHSSIDSFGSSENSLGQSQEKVVERRASQSERPKSMEELETTAFALSTFAGELDPHSSALTRHGSTRSTRSDRLDYSEVATFLKSGLQDKAQSRKEKQQQDDSTPELLETFENQLTNLRKDLESKDRMLSMYENSMADLNSTVHSLKRSLEAKEHAIKHLTEERNRFDYNPYDTRSLAPSRLAPSEMGGISDGALSDEAESKEEVNPKKKKKLWKKILRKKKDNDLPMNADVVSIAGSIGPGGGKGLRRSHSRGKQDLMSISEYGGVDSRPLRMEDAKSLNLDARSDYGGYIPPFPENILTVYEEEGPGVSVMVELQPSYKSKENNNEKIILGSLKLQPDISWVTMDNKICEIFKHHIDSIDPEGYLGLTDESILRYYIGDLLRSIGNALLPHVTPYDVAVSTQASISIIMRGPAEESCDSLAYETLINAELLQTYIAMIVDTHWVVVMGTKGTCKTALAEGMASHLELMMPGNESEDDDDNEEPSSSCFKLSVAGRGLEIATKFIREEVPKKMKELSCTPILVLDGVYDANALEQIFVVASSLPQRPYIIATLCSGGGGTRGIPLHQLMFHHNIRVITCSPQAEPALGILARFLRKKMYKLKANPECEIEPVSEQLISWLPLVLDHINFFIARFHSNSVALGPRVFMNCPLDSSPGEMEVWFLNLWNHFVIPYLMGTIMAGIETYTADPNLDWLDVREWVVDTYPWPQSHNVMKLRTLTPDDVGWNHAVRPQNRFMYLKDGTRIDDDTQSVLRMKPIDHLL